MNSAQSFAQVPATTRSRGAAPSVEALEDVLYDILASGVDPGSAPGTLEAVQFFLHEHARQRKSPAELVAFFDACGLSYGRDLQHIPSADIALPPIELHNSSAAISVNGLAAPQQRESRNPWLWLASACALSLLGIAAAFAYATVTNMRAEIAQVRTNSATQAAALAQVNSEAQTLRANMAETTTLVRSVDQKSELLLQTLVSPLDPAAR